MFHQPFFHIVLDYKVDDFASIPCQGILTSSLSCFLAQMLLIFLVSESPDADIACRKRCAKKVNRGITQPWYIFCRFLHGIVWNLSLQERVNLTQ